MVQNVLIKKLVVRSELLNGVEKKVLVLPFSEQCFKVWVFKECFNHVFHGCCFRVVCTGCLKRVLFKKCCFQCVVLGVFLQGWFCRLNF